MVKNILNRGFIHTFFIIIKLLDKKFEWNHLGYSLDFKKYSKREIFNPKYMNKAWDKYSPPQKKVGGQIYFVSDLPTTPKSLVGSIRLSTTLSLSIRQISKNYFYVYFSSDSVAEPEVRNIIKGGGYVVPHLDAKKTRYRFIDELANKAMQQTWQIADRLSHLDLGVHENICQAINMTKTLDGDYLELGVYKGGSLQTAANYIFMSESKLLNSEFKRGKKVIGLDTFNGFDYHHARDSSDLIFQDTHKLYGTHQTIANISANLECSRTPYELIPVNIIIEPIPEHIRKVSVCNIDVDLYEATFEALVKVSPLIVVSGIIICEDPASTPALYGSLVAMNDFLNTEEGRKYIKIFLVYSYFLIKIIA